MAKDSVSGGRTTLVLFDEQGKSIHYSLNADKNILVMSHDDGRLLIGDHDFSYTLNRRF